MKCQCYGRLRSMMYAVTAHFSPDEIILAPMKPRKDIRGVGCSDWGYTDLLAEKFDYVNTFYDREPQLDLCNVDWSRWPPGSVDFITCTDVLEHVEPPIERAFDNMRRLLKPGGVAILTVPTTLEPATREHFPDLHDWRIETEGEQRVVVNRRRDGTIERFDNLCFHGGEGLTLEFRLFSRARSDRQHPEGRPSRGHDLREADRGPRHSPRRQQLRAGGPKTEVSHEQAARRCSRSAPGPRPSRWPRWSTSAFGRPTGSRPIVCTTGQHRQMLDQVTEYFGIAVDRDLDLMAPNQTLADVTARCLTGLDAVLAEYRPDCIVAQGDTTTVMAAALAAFYRRVPLVHVEAGLRTGDLQAPWPEELNRRIASLVTALHCAPTDRAAENLLREGTPPKAST